MLIIQRSLMATQDDKSSGYEIVASYGGNESHIGAEATIARALSEIHAAGYDFVEIQALKAMTLPDHSQAVFGMVVVGMIRGQIAHAFTAKRFSDNRLVILVALTVNHSIPLPGAILPVTNVLGV